MLVALVLFAGVVLLAAATLVGVGGGVTSARSSARVSAAGGFAALPVPLRGLVSGTLGRSERAFWVRRAGAGFVLVNGAQGLSADFSDAGVRVFARGGRLELSLAGVGYGSSLRALRSRAPSADGNRVSYADGPLVQWFENGPLGLEQGFTLRARPVGVARGPVTVALGVGGSLRARLVRGGEAVNFVAPGGGVALRYVGLRAVDARGRVLPVWLDATAGRLLVRVDARGARYPLRIDPFVQQGRKLVGTGAAGDAKRGFSVALSGDGDTALVGAPGDNDNVGAVWVFTRSGTTWTQQGPKLVGTPAIADANQGLTVALSRDGNTALVGGPSYDASYGASTAGAAWVFTRSGTTWTQQGPELVGTGGGGDANQGSSVALSRDGNTALVGGSSDNVEGAVWVFTRSRGRWTQQGRKLVGTGAVGDASQGTSVALSPDGHTALVGGPDDKSGKGAVWVFTRSRGRWTQQGAKLVGTGAVGDAEQGTSVALSPDGNTALVGAPDDNRGKGAAWVFTRSRGRWTQQGAKLVGTGAVGHAYQGTSVALSGDGNTALVGGNGDNGDAGAAWVFVRRRRSRLAARRRPTST